MLKSFKNEENLTDNLKEAVVIAKDLIKFASYNKINLCGFKFGKIPEDDPYTDSQIFDEPNKFSVNFNTSLRSKVTNYIQFLDRASLVHTWQRILSPGSKLDFTLEHHKGSHLNYLFDIEFLNESHPVSYIFVSEYFGDRRAQIKNKVSDDSYYGYSSLAITCVYR